MVLRRIGLGVCVWFALAAAVRGDDVPFFRGDAARSGSTSETIPPQASGAGLTALWTTVLGTQAVFSTPVVGGGRVYVGAEDGRFYCLSQADGSLLWSYQTGGCIRGSAAYWKGRVYVGSRDGNLYCLHAQTGELVWSVFHGGWQQSSPLVVTVPALGYDVVYFGVGDPSRHVQARHALTGAAVWASPPLLGQQTMSSPAWHAASGRIIIGDNTGHWTAFDGVTGATAWSVDTDMQGVFMASAAVAGDRVIFCTGDYDRQLRMVDAWTGAVIKAAVDVRPGSAMKAGANPVTGAPAPEFPQTWISPDDHVTLTAMLKPERDEYIDALAKDDGFDAAKLKEYFDRFDPPPAGGRAKPGDVVNWSLRARSSCPAIANDLALISHRQLSGTANDQFFTVAVNTDPASGTGVAWGESLASDDTPQIWVENDLVASPAVSAGAWVYHARGRYLMVRNAADGTQLGRADAGSEILGGPTLANGHAIVTTANGRIMAYQTGNQCPTVPTTFTPSGGLDLNGNSKPTLSWSGHSDAETPLSGLVCQVQYALGYAHRDLEIQTDPPLTLAAGATSYAFSKNISHNTHVYWRVRVRDAAGASSAWSDTQEFWIKRDQNPPSPPQDVTAVAQNAAVLVSWSDSHSPDILKYRLYHKRTSDTWASGTLIDDLTSGPYTVTGLVNYISYDFMVTAVDAGENESTGVVVTAMPEADVTIEGTGSFATVQAAIDAAAPGETIVLGPKTFNENLILRAGVSLRGRSPNHTILLGLGSGTVVAVEGTYGAGQPSTISNLAVTGGTTGIDAGTADVMVRNVLVYEMGGNAITGAAGGRLQVVNATLMSNGLSEAGSGVLGAGLTTVRNTISGNNSAYGVSAPAASVVTYNTAFGNTLANYAAGVSGIGNVELPVALNPDYTERQNSRSVDAGDPLDDYSLEPAPNGDCINMGAFGNTEYAATSPGPRQSADTDPVAAAGGGGSGGSFGCGALGIEFVLALLALRGARRRRWF